MSERLTQQDYWNARDWQDYGEPLLPTQADVAFQVSQLQPGGDAMILGATRELCEAARDVSGTVMAVDFAANVVRQLRVPGVTYQNQEWLEYFADNPDRRFDNIMTDGGLLCLDFPTGWERIIDRIHHHLHPGGVFSARIYVSSSQPPLDSYQNPNLQRFITSMKGLDAQSNWTLRPQHPDYAAYDVRYALPPQSVVLQKFGRFALKAIRTPDYEAGEHFPSFAFQKTA